MTLTDTDSYSPSIDETRHELREGIETSREIVRQSRMLIEISECGSAAVCEDADCGIAR